MILGVASFRLAVCTHYQRSWTLFMGSEARSFSFLNCEDTETHHDEGWGEMLDARGQRVLLSSCEVFARSNLLCDSTSSRIFASRGSSRRMRSLIPRPFPSSPSRVTGVLSRFTNTGTPRETPELYCLWLGGFHVQARGPRLV